MDQIGFFTLTGWRHGPAIRAAALREVLQRHGDCGEVGLTITPLGGGDGDSFRVKYTIRGSTPGVQGLDTTGAAQRHR